MLPVVSWRLALAGIGITLTILSAHMGHRSSNQATLRSDRGGARYRVRTCDPIRVKDVLYR